MFESRSENLEMVNRRLIMMCIIIHIFCVKQTKLNSHKSFSSSVLKKPKLVAETLLECIRTGDLESFRDVLTSHLMSINKLQLAKKAGLNRRTLYCIIDRKKKI